MKIRYQDLIKDVSNGKNMQQVLPEYMSTVMTAYHNQSLLELCFTFYDFATTFEEMPLEDETINQLYQEINSISHEMIVNGQGLANQEAMLTNINGIRERIIDYMDVLTMYADKFTVFEYILNRKELEYEESFETMDEEEFFSRALHYVVQSKDTQVMMNNLKEVVEQLPVRLTKNKYIEIIRDGLMLLKGAKNDSIKTYFYMLRTCAMVYRAKEESNIYGEFAKEVDYFLAFDYKNCSKEEYQLAVNRLQATAATIAELTDRYMLMQDIVNNLYSYLLTMPYARTVFLEEECNNVLHFISTKAKNSSLLEEEDAFVTLVKPLEGKMEELYPICQNLASVFDVVLTQHMTMVEAMMLNTQAQIIKRVLTLKDTSPFIDFRDEYSDDTVEDSELEAAIGELLEELMASFSGRSILINRAVMANTLTKIPVFLHTGKEVHDYIRNSIELCTNKAEKTMSMRLINEIIDREEAFDLSYGEE